MTTAALRCDGDTLGRRAVARPGDVVDISTLGGKAGALWRLASAGFPLPRLAVVTTAAYLDTVDSPELRDALATLSPPGTDDEGQRDIIDGLFLGAHIDDSVAREVTRAAAEVGGGQGIAVRSSATAEDLHGASFAGQYRSFLDVRGDSDVMRAVRLTWASTWYPAARHYRHEQGMDDDVAMAVLLMELVPPVTAGVAFTVDPAGDGEHLRVESVAGFADRLVGGEETPEVHVLRRDEVAIAAPVVGAVAELALRCERFFGCPQDIEWAWNGQDVYLLQSRPITVLGSIGDDGFDTVQQDRTYTTAGIAEMLPGTITPLVWDTVRLPMDEAFRSLFDSLGAGPGDLRSPVVARVNGRAALDLDSLTSVAGGLDSASASELERQLLGVAPDDDQPDHSVSWWRRLMQDLRVASLRTRSLREGDVFSAAVPFVVGAEIDMRAMTDVELLAYRARLIGLLARGIRSEMAVAAAAASSYQRLEAFLRRYVGAEAGALAVRLTRGDTSPIALRRWLELARAAQGWPGGRAALEAPDWAAADACLGDDADAERFRSMFDAALRDAGSMAIITGPTWSENRDAAWRTVRSATVRRGRVADDSLTVASAAELLATTRRWRRLQVFTGLVFDTQRVLLRRHVADATELADRREGLKSSLLTLGGEIRRVHLDVGRRLVERGRLASPSDVDHLAASEIAPSLAGGGPSRVVLLRRGRWLRQTAAEPLPLRFVGRPAAAPPTVPSGERLAGWAASSGTYEGTARIVEGAGDLLLPGEVLVARTTDPSWAPLFLIAGALIVEQGGPLSHAAVVARELGLPAVVNVPGALERIRPGMRVRVDGARGDIAIVPSAEVLP